MTKFKFIFLTCFALLLIHDVHAQQTDTTSKLKITSINITGNKTTKTYIILREVPFKPGDSLLISKLFDSLEQTRRQVHNLNLFSEESVTATMLSANDIAINITVREKWFIYPTPQFQLVDRNFNDWVKTYHADFNRVVYGIKFAHYNFSGRGDQLRIYLLNGYARNISFSYNAPYSNSKLSEGFSIGGGYTQNREVSFKTTYTNKLLNFKNPGFVRNSIYGNIVYQLRGGFFTRHFISAGYSYVSLNDSIIGPKYNPHYFNSNNSTRGIVDLAYSFSYSNTNNNNYPLAGKRYGITILKRGLGISGGINMLSLSGAYSRYISHGKNWYSAFQSYSKIILPFEQSYINQRSIGYADFYLRGLEYYVIDGVAASVAKYTLRKKLFAFNINVPFHIKAVPRIPFAFYAKAYGDAGYSYIQKEFDTRLNNRLLYTCGFGIDILSLYDSNINVEYSINQLGESGIFLHGRTSF